MLKTVNVYLNEVGIPFAAYFFPRKKSGRHGSARHTVITCANDRDGRAITVPRTKHHFPQAH